MNRPTDTTQLRKRIRMDPQMPFATRQRIEAALKDFEKALDEYEHPPEPATNDGVIVRSLITALVLSVSDASKPETDRLPAEPLIRLLRTALQPTQP